LQLVKTSAKTNIKSENLQNEIPKFLNVIFFKIKNLPFSTASKNQSQKRQVL